jgi:two-component system chemotaxis response regulator CheB
MDKIRVLVVDASPDIRKILTEYLSADPAIKVVGVAANHSSAIKQIEKLQPDIITLHEDLFHPTHDAILQHGDTSVRQLPLIVLGTIDEPTKSILQNHPPSKRGRHGTSRKRAIVCKSPGDRRFTEICSRIHQILARRTMHDHIRMPSAPVQGKAVSDITIIGIAVSTGGPNALLKIASQLSPELVTPIVITQHMPGQFTPLLAERINSRSALQVCEAQHQQPVEAGWIYLAPGDMHLTIEHAHSGPRIALSDAPKMNSCRPSADIMFRSLADVFGARALALVLTGMGIDGQEGCRYLKEKGGLVIAQDEETSTVWGMPKAVIHAGLADEVLPLSEIALTINTRFIKKPEEK